MPVQINTDGDIDGFLYDLSIAADMVVNRIQKNNRINGLQRSLLPLLPKLVRRFLLLCPFRLLSVSLFL